MTRAYVKTPKHIIMNNNISSDAKVVYVFLLDRQSVSEKNGWKDENGRTFIIFPISEIMKILNCSKSKASKVLSELDGLIEKKRRGQGKPDVIYIKSEFKEESRENITAEIFDTKSNPETFEEENHELQKSTTGNSAGNTEETFEVLNIAPNKNNINKNKINNINSNNQSYHINQYDLIEDRIEYIKLIKQKIQYDYLIQNYSKPVIDDIVSIMTNAVCSRKEFTVISGEEIPTCLVKEKLLSLDHSHVEYVFECLTKSKTRVKNMSRYLLASLYNAHDVIGIHYMNMAYADMATS